MYLDYDRDDVVWRAAEMYVDDSRAAHGDVEKAKEEARLWLDLFEQAEDALYDEEQEEEEDEEEDEDDLDDDEEEN